LAPVGLVGVGFAALIYTNADWLADTLGGEDHATAIASYLRVLAPIVPLASLNYAVLGATRGFGTMVPTATIQHMGRGLSQPLLVWALLTAGVSAAGVALGWTTPFIVGVSVSSLWLTRLIQRHPRGGDTTSDSGRSIPHRFWAFTIPRSFAAMFRVGVQWIDVLIVGALLDPADVAIYAVSTRLLQLGLFVASSVGEVAQPMFGGLLAAGHRTRAQEVYQTATGWQVAVTWPQYITAALFAAVILRTVFGDGYEAGAAVVAILALSTMVGAAAGPVDMMLLMAGKSTWSLWNAGITLTTNVVLNLILIPDLGIEGAAIAWAASRLLANAIPLVQVHRYVHIHPFGRGTMVGIAAASLVFGGIGVPIWLIAGDRLAALLVFLFVAGAVYAAVCWRLRDTLELPAAWSALRSRRTRSAGST
jgi:O-antigen/teichoic acid export membrane protein